MWTYYGSLFIGYPLALVGFFLWRKGKAPEKKNLLNQSALILLVVGLICSIAALFLFL